MKLEDPEDGSLRVNTCSFRLWRNCVTGLGLGTAGCRLGAEEGDRDRLPLVCESAGGEKTEKRLEGDVV